MKAIFLKLMKRLNRHFLIYFPILREKVIRHIGNAESCVIVGRTSDYILRYYHNVFSVNIQAQFEKCVDIILYGMKRKFNII